MKYLPLFLGIILALGSGFCVMWLIEKWDEWLNR